MSGKYVANTGEQTVSATQDLVEMQVPNDATVKVRRVQITQSSDAGDSESEQLNATLKRCIGSTSGSVGAALTPAKKQSGDAASGCTCERNNTTVAVAGGGSLDDIMDEDFNVMAGLSLVFPPGEEIVLSPGEEFYVNISAPADALTLSCSVEFVEEGG